MEIETVKLPKQLLESVRAVVKDTRLYSDEMDFINQAIVKQISKYK